MDMSVDDGAHFLHLVVYRQLQVLGMCGKHGIHFGVDARGQPVGHTPFVTFYAGLHGHHVVAFALLPARVVTPQLHLGGFQIVARVKLIRDTHRTDIQCFEGCEEVFLAHRQHMQHAGLRQVVAVFGAPLALCEPD